jgi:hypothetical protein
MRRGPELRCTGPAENFFSKSFRGIFCKKKFFLFSLSFIFFPFLKKTYFGIEVAAQAKVGLGERGQLVVALGQLALQVGLVGMHLGQRLVHLLQQCLHLLPLSPLRRQHPAQKGKEEERKKKKRKRRL